MKIQILVFVLLLSAVQAFSQKKSKVDPKDAQIDSITRVNKNLTLQVDSLKGEMVKYVGLYNTIKDKILHYDFDPTRSAFLIDSLQASRDSAAVLISKKPVSSPPDDGISLTLNEIKTDIMSIKAQLNPGDDSDKTRAINSLKQLKDLLDNKIITEEEFIAMKKKFVEKL